MITLLVFDVCVEGVENTCVLLTEVDFGAQTKHCVETTERKYWLIINLGVRHFE